MKKVYLLLLVLPLFVFSQNTLVKWYNSNLTPSYSEINLTASSLTASGGVSINNDTSEGSFSPFYRAGNWPKPTYNSNPSVLDPSKYLQFTVSPDAGYKMKVDQFQFNSRTQGVSSVFQVRYSKNADFSNYSVLQNEKELSTTFTSSNLNFPANTVINSGSTLYIRIYVYKTENNFHLQHNVTGSIAPTLSGSVSLETPVLPTVKDDRTGTVKNKAVNIDVLANDNYRFSGSLLEINATKPTHGTVVVNGVNNITYTPDLNYVGYDSFYYTVKNSIGVSGRAKVELQVIDGAENVLVRWNKVDMTPKNYTSEVLGSNMTVSKENIFYTSYASAFEISGLPTTQEFDGKLDAFRYLSVSLQSANEDSFISLKSFKLTYRGGGAGNITVKYSRTPDFSGPVYTLLDDASYNADWVDKDLQLPDGTFLFPSENLYIRIYTYNTWNNFFIKFAQDGEAGPAFTGISTGYAPEPCTSIVTWNGTKWSALPTINKKAVIAGDYTTALNGKFEACSLSVNAGKLTVSSGFPVTIMNDVNVAAASSMEVQNDANLIQINDASNNAGNITVLRDFNIGANRTQYNYVGSPVTFIAGQNLKTIYPGIAFALYHNEANNLFGTSSGANIPGRGLAIKEPSGSGAGSITAKFIGVPQNGIIDFALANSNTASNTSLGYNLLANPYASNIDLDQLYKNNSGAYAAKNISATFYLWDNTVNNDIAIAQQGSSYKAQAYGLFNAVAGKKGTGTSAAGYNNNPVKAKKVPTQIIKVGQGFMTKALVKGYTLRFDNSIRTSAAATSDFFGKTGNQEEEDDRFWLKMVSPANLATNLAVVYFEGGDNNYGAEDSQAKGASDEIYTLVNDNKASIDGRSAFSKTDVVALGSSHFASGTYSIEIEKSEGIFNNGQNIYLKDLQTGIITNLSQGKYSFNADAGETSGRFEIIYKPETTLSTDAAVKEEVFVYKNGTDFMIDAKSQKITGLEVYDMSGRLLMKLQPNAKKAVINAATLGNGAYLLKIDQSGMVTGKKIIK